MNEIEINGIIYVEKNKQEKSKYCTIRTYSAGVWVGIVDKMEGKYAEISDARRLWYWSGAASLSELAVNGVKNPDDCKFPTAVDQVILTEVIEVIPMTEKAIESIKGVKVWEA